MKQEEMSKIIEKARKEKGLTQQQLAEILGVSNTAISKWEHGNNLPDISMLKPISEALDIDMMELIDLQNTTHEDLSKKFHKQKRNKLIKKIIITVIIIFSLLDVYLITYLNHTKSENEIIENSVEVYKIRSSSDSFNLDGYLIFDNHENLILLEKLVYQGVSQGTKGENKYTDVKISIVLNEKILLNRRESSSKSQDINEFLEPITHQSSVSKTNIKEEIDNLEDLYLEIRMEKENGKVETKKVDLLLEKKFTQ